MHVLKSLTASWDKPTVASIVSFVILLAAYCAFEAAGLVMHDNAWTAPLVIAVFVLLLAALMVRPHLANRFEDGFSKAKPFVLVGLVFWRSTSLKSPTTPPCSISEPTMPS